MKKVTILFASILISATLFSQYTEVWVKYGLVYGEHEGDPIWNPGSIKMPELIPFDEGYRMYYEVNNPDSSQIQFADSPDGITWTYEGIALRSDTCTDTTNRLWSIGAPSVIKIDSTTYRMYYAATEPISGDPKFYIRSAISTNGSDFTDEGIRIDIYPYDPQSNLILAGHGTFFTNNTGGVTGIFSGNLKGTNEPSSLFVTTSDDGLNFDNFQLKYHDWHDPVVVKKDGSYLLYAKHLNDKFGTATSPNGTYWPDEMDSVSFTDSVGVQLLDIGDLGGVLMSNNEIWIYSNYGAPSRDFALFKLSNPVNIKKTVTQSNSSRVYPNPVTNESVISFNKGNVVLLTIIDNQGRTLAHKKLFNTSSISLNEFDHFPAGIYHYTLTVDGILETGKFIKAK